MAENLSKEKVGLSDRLIQSLGLALTNSALYPPDHPVFNSSMKSFKVILDKWLIAEGKVELGISPNNILLNGAFVKEDSALYGGVAAHLHKKGLMAVSFTEGVDMAELLQFFSFLKNDADVISEKGGIAKNIGIMPHLMIKEVDYSSLLTSAKTAAAIDEKTMWQLLSGMGKELKQGRLCKSNAEFITGFLKNPKKAAAMLNMIYKEAPAKPDGRSAAEEIRDVFSEMNKYFDRYPAGGEENTKKELVDIMSNLDPGLVVSLFKDKAVEDDTPDLADELFKGFPDDMTADFIASLMQSGNNVNEKMVRLFDRLLSGRDKSDGILSIVTDKLFNKKLLNRNALSALQNSIKDLFETHPDDDFIMQMYNLTVGAFLNKDKAAESGPGRYPALTGEYYESLKEDNLKKEKIRLLLNILWVENDTVRFKKASDILVSSFREILAPKHIKNIKEVFELLCEKLKPTAQMNDNAIASTVKNTLERIGGGEITGTLISFIPEIGPEALDDIAYVLINAKEASAGRLLDLFMKEEDGVNRSKFGYVLSMLDGRIAKEVSSRIETAVNSSLFSVIDELYEILKRVDMREARIVAGRLIKNKNARIRSWALEEFSPDSVEEKNSMLEILGQENSPEIKKKILIALVKTKDGEIVKKLFESAGRGFFKKIAFGDNSNARFSVVRKVLYTFLHHKNSFLLDLVTLCGAFKVEGSLAYLKMALSRRPFINTTAIRELRIQSVLSLARIGTPEAMEFIMRSADDPDKSVRAMCKLVLES
ncbi:MAG: hypothetical protein Q8N91_04120 [Candidatus Omnitrophota bacterium]|nr:hypothetical protein [Candidatus Omnitrophota bacterium]